MTERDVDEIRRQLGIPEAENSDIDKDGVPILEDCDPLDPRHQDFSFSGIKSAIKEGANKLRGKYEELKRKKEQREELSEVTRRKGDWVPGEWRKEAEQGKRLQQLERKAEELEKEKQVKKRESEIKKLERQTESRSGGGGLTSLLKKFFSPDQTSASRESQIDKDDKWAVVDEDSGSIVATFPTKAEANSAKSLGDSYKVLATSVALQFGEEPRSRGQLADVFGAEERSPRNDMSLVGGGRKGEDLKFGGLVGGGKPKDKDDDDFGGLV